MIDLVDEIELECLLAKRKRFGMFTLTERDLCIFSSTQGDVIEAEL
jgi:hypothetical protein